MLQPGQGLSSDWTHVGTLRETPSCHPRAGQVRPLEFANAAPGAPGQQATLGPEQEATYPGLLVRLDFPLCLLSRPHKDMTVREGGRVRRGDVL